jgi:prolyl oligopeptidase
VSSSDRYPPTLLVTGDHDTRVDPLHSRKFAARVQQAGGGPILLRVLNDTGGRAVQGMM